MKTVVIIPIKSNSKRVKKKNFKKIHNVPLYQIVIKKKSKKLISMKYMLIPIARLLKSFAKITVFLLLID